MQNTKSIARKQGYLNANNFCYFQIRLLRFFRPSFSIFHLRLRVVFQKNIPERYPFLNANILIFSEYCMNSNDIFSILMI